MAYTPPIGTADFSIGSVLGYTPPVGTVNLDIGQIDEIDRQVWIAGQTAAPRGLLDLRHVYTTVISGRTATPIGLLRGTYDPNIPSAVHALTEITWQEGETTPQGIQEGLQEALPIRPGSGTAWTDAALLGASRNPSWQDSPSLAGAERATWQDAGWAGCGKETRWQDSPRLDQSAADNWQDSQTVTTSVANLYKARLPLGILEARPVWQHGAILTNHVHDGMQDGLRIIAVEVEIWQQAGYPGNAPNPGPPIPPIIRWPWGTDLNLRCPLPGTTLRIGRSPCILVAEREIPYRRSYMTANSASLVRWPDLTPLPVTSMTIETDFDSWCWALTATLAGSEAWALVQPAPLACQVQATINGQAWLFLLDVPSRNLAFNSDSTTIKGRSRSAWLSDPYTTSRNLSQTRAREMQQLGEAALANTGWTLDWQGENWVVPVGRYTTWNTPIGELIRLANATDDGLYSHPYLEVISLIKRWPVASWLIDGETASLAIPDAAILSLTQSPVYTQPYNGVYVSGTSHGRLALVKIAGTDGTLQPDEPLTHELLCDTSGVAARQRGLNALSDSGAGWEMDADTLFNPTANPAFPLVPPGQIVSIAGLKGVSRSCRITVGQTNGALSVRQGVGLERREVEDA